MAHYNRTKLAAGDQVKVAIPEGEVARCRITEVKSDGVISVTPLDGEVIASSGKKKNRKSETAGLTADVSHASVAAKGEPHWYAFNPGEKLDSSEEGVLSLEHSGPGQR